MTYKHYMEQPMPMVEKRINRKLYKNEDFIDTVDHIDLTLHMGGYERGKDNICDSMGEGE